MSESAHSIEQISLPVDAEGQAAVRAAQAVEELRDAPRPARRWRSVLRRLGPAGPMALAALLLPAAGGLILLLGYLDPVAEWLRVQGRVGLALYVLGFMVLGGFALIPTYANSILGGYAFGFSAGYPAAMAGLVAYFLARRMSADNVSQLLQENPKWLAVRDALLEGGFWKVLLIVTLLRLPPNAPFAASNVVMAAAKVRPLPFALGTLFGMAPRTGFTVFAVAGLMQLDFQSDQPRELFIAGLVVTFAVIIIIGIIARRAVARVTAPRTAPDLSA